MDRKIINFALVQIAMVAASIAPSMAFSHGQSMSFHGNSHQSHGQGNYHQSNNYNNYHQYHHYFSHHQVVFIDQNDYYHQQIQSAPATFVQPVKPAPVQDHIPHMEVQTYNW
jgi:hypothetical protein